MRRPYLYLIFTAIISILAIPPTIGTLGTGIVGYWDCDSNLQDSSGSHSTSTIFGTGTVRVNTSIAKLGPGSCQFDKADLDISNETIYNMGNAMSLNMWVYPTGSPASKDALMGKANPCGYYYERGYGLSITSAGQFRWDVELGGIYIVQSSLHSIAYNDWQMVTITHNVSLTSFYYNGVFQSSWTGGGIDNTPTGMKFQLGDMWCAGTHQGVNPKANLDEAAVWNRYLAPEEVSTLYNAGVGFNPFGTTCVRPYSTFSVNQTNYTFTPSEWQSGSGPNIIDGNYATFGLSPTQLVFSYINFEYEKPINAVNASWYFKDGCGGGGGSAGYLDVPQSCFSAYADRLLLRAGSKQITAGNGDANWECYDGGAWYVIRGNNGVNCYELYGQELKWTVQALPNATASLQSNLTLIGSPIPHYNLTVNGIYLNTTESGGTGCHANFNTSSFNCSNFTLNDCNSVTTTDCAATGIQEKWVLGNVSCDNGIHSHDYLFFLDTNNNANVTLDPLSAYNTTPNIPFGFPIYADAWIEAPVCNVFNYSNTMVCNVTPMVLTAPQSYTGNVSCYGSNFSQIQNFFIGQCNGTSLYMNVNSTTYSIIYDPVGPTFTFAHFNDEYGWFTNNITGTWSFYDLNLYRINITIDEQYSIFSQIGLNTTDYTYTLNHFIGNMTPGRHNLTVYMADSHTKKALEKEWTTSKSLLGNEMQFDVGKGKEKNSITIAALDKDTFFNPWETEKTQDKITFKYSSKKNLETYHFEITSTKPIDIIDNPKTKWKKWIVTGDEWVDFYTEDEPDAKVSIVRNSENSVIFEVGGIKDFKSIEFQSVGEINSIHEHYQFNVYNTTLTYLPSIVEGQSQNSTLTINHGAQPMNYSQTFTYNFTTHPISTTSYGTYDVLSSQFYSPSVVTTSNLLGTWLIKTVGENNSITFNQTVNKIALTLDCSNGSYVNAITFYGRDEDTDLNVTFDMNIDFSLWTDNILLISQVHLELRNNSQYDICLFPNSTVYQMNAILEYEAAGYSHRKYYLYNTTISAIHQDVFLYLLPTTETTDTTAEVLDGRTTDSIPGAYIRVLRYYPGRSGTATYSQVEVAKTDNNGKTIIKLRAIDTFYRFIIEYPAGIIRLETEVQKVLTGTKTFLINLDTTSGLEVWSRVQDMSTIVDCDKTTKTCSYSWANSGLTARAASLRVYEMNGIDKTLLYNQTVYASAGAIAFVIPNYKNNTRYVAEAEVLGYDDVQYPAGSDDMITVDTLFGQLNFRKAALFPYLLIVLVLVFAFVDIGAVGVATAGLVALIAGWMFGIMAFNTGLVAGLIICFGVIIFKISRS